MSELTGLGSFSLNVEAFLLGGGEWVWKEVSYWRELFPTPIPVSHRLICQRAFDVSFKVLRFWYIFYGNLTYSTLPVAVTESETSNLREEGFVWAQGSGDVAHGGGEGGAAGVWQSQEQELPEAASR